MRALEEMQFELLNSEYDEDGVAFGIGLPVSVDDDGFDPGELSWLSQDSQDQQTGNRMFGRDAAGGTTWTFAMHVNRHSTTTALESLAELAKAWRGTHVADRPGEVAPLRYRVGHRVRRVYGRPRRWAAPPSNRILGGFIPITATFDTVDDLYYDDVMQSAELTFNLDSDGGFVLPSTLPIHTRPRSERAREAVNGGDMPTNPIIRFDGPVDDPKLVGPGWAVSLKVNLEAGEFAVVDTRPWRMTAMRNGTASIGGRLSRRQHLSDVLIHPGSNTLLYSGSSSSATSTCTVHWRSAYSSL